MFRFGKGTITAACVAGVTASFLASDATAQCSRGGGMTAPTGRLTTMTGVPSSATNFGFASQAPRSYPNAAQFAMQQQVYQRNQLLSAMRQQVARQQTRQRSVNQGELLAMRRQRAEQTRARRVERIAIAKAEREAARSQSPGAPSPEMYVSTRNVSDLNSLVAKISPFEP